LGDDESVSDDDTSIASLPGFPSAEAQDLDGEARRIVARARHNTGYAHITTNDLALPFRVPRENDPTIWSIRVEVGVLHYFKAGTNN
jgi:hypothetical protein